MKTNLDTLWSDLRELNMPVWALLAGTLINSFGTFVVFFLVLFLTRLGFTPVQAGLAASTFSLGGMAAALIGGYLADRVGPRAVIILSMFASAVTMLMFAQVKTLPLMLLLSLLAGLSTQLHGPATATLLTQLTPEDKRVTAFALLRFSANFGSTLGPIAAGLLLERSPTYLFVGDALTSIIFGLIAIMVLPRMSVQANQVATPRVPFNQIFKHRDILKYNVYIIIMNQCTYLSAFFSSFFIRPSNQWKDRM